MNLTINKKQISDAIADLPEDTTVEQAIERLIVLHKVQKGMNEKGGISQREAENYFRQRKDKRTD